MAYPAELKYTKDHEWVRVTGDTAEVGITDYAQQQLGDVVYVELPDVGRAITQVEAVLGAEGRVLVRYSGTESKARVMIEGTDEAGIRAHADQIAKTLQEALAG